MFSKYKRLPTNLIKKKTHDSLNFFSIYQRENFISYSYNYISIFIFFFKCKLDPHLFLTSLFSFIPEHIGKHLRYIFFLNRNSLCKTSDLVWNVFWKTYLKSSGLVLKKYRSGTHNICVLVKLLIYTGTLS